MTYATCVLLCVHDNPQSRTSTLLEPESHEQYHSCVPLTGPHFVYVYSQLQVTWLSVAATSAPLDSSSCTESLSEAFEASMSGVTPYTYVCSHGQIVGFICLVQSQYCQEGTKQNV